jgi:hypothetical protein
MWQRRLAADQQRSAMLEELCAVSPTFNIQLSTFKGPASIPPPD